MGSRILAAAAAIWVAGYTVGYAALVRDQGDAPAIWYLVVLVTACVGFVVTTVQPSRPRPLVAAIALSACASVLGMLTIGVFLVPAILAGIAALAIRPRRPVDGTGSATPGVDPGPGADTSGMTSGRA